MMSLKSFVRWASLAAALCATPALVQAETHAQLQAVTSTGQSAWSGTVPFTIQGVLLGGPEEMLDATPNFAGNPASMGGEWQIAFQAVAPGDRGGSTCWMGQNYGSLAWVGDELSYTDEAWVSEVLRLNHDPATGHAFRAGDLIEVTVRRSLPYGGKRNINEAHDTEPEANFEIRLVEANHGLPTPEIITLADVMGPGGDPANWQTWPTLFDATRATGGEHYQGMRVRLNDLTLVNASGWSHTNLWSNRRCTVTDGAGRCFLLRHPRYDLGPAPAGQFDVVGIFTQEGTGAASTNGYELFVQQVLPHFPTPELAIGLNLTISWPATSDSYQLEWRSQADAGTWSPVTSAPVVINGLHTVILPPASPQRFYRLRKLN
jgi:hypothetical protein